MGRRDHVDLATADGQDRYVPSDTRDILSAGHEGVYEWATANLVHEGTRVLDFGCGTGYGSALVTAAGGTYDGADGSPAAIDFARTRYARPGVRFFVADLMEPLPAELEPGSYDVVFSSEVLEHVVDPFAFVRTMADYLRDDGTCFMGTPNRSWSKDNMPGNGLLALSHVMEFTPPALVALLRTCFDDVTLMHRVFPAEAIPALVPANRPPLVRGVLAFAREVMPAGLDQYKKRFARGGAGQEWVPDDIQWLAPDDPGLDPARSVGLAVVCRGPRR
ncbi:MAG: class I SAM-dependent methyltransferase [Acidimicrobiales bacterium]